MNRLLVWGGIFAAGIWVGSELTKKVVQSKITGAVASGLGAIGLGADKPYGRDAITWVDSFVGEKFKQ